MNLIRNVYEIAIASPAGIELKGVLYHFKAITATLHSKAPELIPREID